MDLFIAKIYTAGACNSRTFDRQICLFAYRQKWFLNARSRRGHVSSKWYPYTLGFRYMDCLLCPVTVYGQVEGSRYINLTADLLYRQNVRIPRHCTVSQYTDSSPLNFDQKMLANIVKWR